MRKFVRLSVDVSPELNKLLERLADRLHGNKSDVIRRGIALMELAVKARDDGKKIGVAEKGQSLSTEFIGVI